MRRLLVPATLVGLWACGEDRASGTAAPGVDRPTRVDSRPGETGYREIEVALGGSISGRVTWVGERPAEVIASTGAASACGETDRVPTLEIGPRGGIRGAVVVLRGIREGRPRDLRDTPTLRIARCRIEPHVLAVGSGATLRIENTDPMLHNAHATDASGSTRFDLGLPEQGASAALSLDRPGILRVVDDAGHPSTLGWIHVIEHPYFAVTDDSGAFRMTSVPTGQYTLEVWHEGVRPLERLDSSGRPILSAPILLSRMVTVVGAQDTAADFSLDLNIATTAGE
jgi:hypothetical protein